MSQLWIPLLDEHMQKLNKSSIYLFSLALLRKVYCISSPPRPKNLVLWSCRILQQCMQALLGITRHQECSPLTGYHKSFAAEARRDVLLPVPAGCSACYILNQRQQERFLIKRESDISSVWNHLSAGRLICVNAPIVLQLGKMILHMKLFLLVL